MDWAHHITTREHQVFALVAEGHTNKEIARNLCIAEHTVEQHLHNIFQKLELRSRTEVAKLFWQRQDSDDNNGNPLLP